MRTSLSGGRAAAASGGKGPTDSYLSLFEDYLEAFIGAELEPRSELATMIRYQLGIAPGTSGRGKRLRPLLCLAVRDGYGGRLSAVLSAAVALELLHNFTLVHDDIEDGDTLRRGVPTVWSRWGLAHGVNAGDLMYALAWRAMLQTEDSTQLSGRRSEVLSLFDEACVRLCEGQYFDLARTARVSSRDAYVGVVERKTSALLELAVLVSVVLSGQGWSEAEAGRAFARHLGVAFQGRDDCLAVWGDGRAHGKDGCSDLVRRSCSLPLVLLFETTPRAKRAVIDALLDHGDAAAFVSIRQLMAEADVLGRAGQFVRTQCDQALEALDRMSLAAEPRRFLSSVATKIGSLSELGVG